LKITKVSNSLLNGTVSSQLATRLNSSSASSKKKTSVSESASPMESYKTLKDLYFPKLAIWLVNILEKKVIWAMPVGI